MSAIQEKIAELHTIRQSKESSAQAHEKAAKEARAEMAEAKVALAELGEAHLKNVALELLQKVTASADVAEALVGDRAKEVTAMMDQLKNALSDVDKLKTELEELKTELKEAEKAE